MIDSRRLLAGLATALSTVTVLVLFTGIAHVPLSTARAWGMLATGVAAGALVLWRSGPTIFGRRPDARRSPRAELLFWLLGGTALAAFAFLAVPLWFRPDMTWDGMSYHLPTIHFWTQKGYVHWIGDGEPLDPFWRHYVDPPINGYPKGAETLGFVLAAVTSSHLANASNFVFLPLGILGVYVGARELGAARAPAFFAATLFALVPTNVAQATCGYVDTAYAACMTAFFASVMIIVRRILMAKPVTWWLVLTSGQLLGLGLGIKAPGVLGAALGVAVIAASALLVQRWRPHEARRGRAVLAHAGRLSVLVLLALAVGGFWYARNWIHRGNPLHPVEVKVAGARIFPGVPLEDQITVDIVTPDYMKPWSTTRQVLHAWTQGGRIEWPPDTLVEHDPQGFAIDVDDPAVKLPAWPRSLRYQDSRAGGLGFVWLGASLPAMIALVAVLARRAAKSRSGPACADLGAFGALVLVVFGCFMGSPLRWWARYTLWIHAPGLMALGVMLERASERRSTARAAQLASVALSGVMAIEYAYALKWSASQPYFVGPPQLHATTDLRAIWRAVTETEDRGCGAIFHHMPSLPREALCSPSRIAVGPITIPHEPIMGQLSSPAGARTVLLAPRAIGADPDAAKAFVEKHLPRYIVWDPERAGPAPVLERTATRWAWLYGLMIFELGNDPNPPPLLLPKP